jgi:hypothetical protein
MGNFNNALYIGQYWPGPDIYDIGKLIHHQRGMGQQEGASYIYIFLGDFVII